MQLQRIGKMNLSSAGENFPAVETVVAGPDQAPLLVVERPEQGGPVLHLAQEERPQAAK